MSDIYFVRHGQAGLRARGEELRLLAFNSVPHLDSPPLRTLR